MIRTFQTPTEYEIMFRECMKLLRAFSGNPKNSQELSGILGTLNNSRQEGDLHACDTDEARSESGGMEGADYGLPGQRAVGYRMVFSKRLEHLDLLPLGARGDRKP